MLDLDRIFREDPPHGDAKPEVSPTRGGELALAPGGPETPRVDGQPGPAPEPQAAEPEADPELEARLDRLTPEERALFGQRVAARREAGEPEAGLPWRALVDVRIARGHWPAPQPDPEEPPGACRRCGSLAVRAVPIHGGQSLRLDCRRCGRFLRWGRWYGRPVGPAGSVTSVSKTKGRLR